MKAKTNRILSLTVALIMLLTLVTPMGVSYADTDGDYTYTIADGKATITVYTGTDTNLVIPDTLGGCPVTAIGNMTFYYKELTSVTLPNTLVTIGEMAFFDNSLETVVIPDSVTTIGDAAFSCNRISSLTLGNNVKTIGANAFSNNNLNTVVIPDGVVTLGVWAFGSNGTLGNSLDVPLNARGKWNVEDIVWVKEVVSPYTYTVTDGNATITGYTGTDTNLVIPDTLGGCPVTAISNSAFSGQVIESVTLPNTLVTIGDFAFILNQITTLDIPDSVTSIGKSAFFENVINILTLGDSLETIGDSAFKSNKICTLTLPTSLTSIGDAAFSENGLLYDSGNIEGSELAGTWNVVGLAWVKEVVSPYTYTITDGKATITAYNVLIGGLTPIIPNTLGGCPVTEVGLNAFKGKGLTGVTLPNTLVTIGEQAFSNNNITKIDIPESVTVIGNIAFYENFIDTLTLGDSLETIGSDSFRANHLQTVVIPNSVITVGANAFIYNGTYDSGTITGSEWAGTWNVINKVWVKVLIPQEKPESVGATASTIPDISCGKLTGTTAFMQYQTDSEHNSHSEYWNVATEGDTEVKPGVYWVRYAATGTKAASEAVERTVDFTSPFAGGTGAELSPYQIETAAQLDAVRYFFENPGTYEPNNFILTKDIDLGVAPYNEGEGWKPIDGDNAFGVLNGNGHVIKNMKIDVNKGYGQGLFRIIEEGHVINLGITDANVIGESYVGILAGLIDSEAHIEKVYVTGIVTGDRYVGGLTGYLGMTDDTIKNCYAIADVTGQDYVGGLVGKMTRSRIVNSYFAGNIVAKNPESLYKGGLVGENNLDEYADVPQPNIFWSNYFYNIADATGFNGDGGTSKSAVEMKNKATYLVGTGEEIWDFDTVWVINPAENNGYPTLRVFGGTPPVTPPTGGGTGGGGGGGSADVSTPTDTSSVTVNGQKENAGKETIQTIDGKVQTVLAVDTTVLSKKIEDVLKEKTDSSQNLVELVVGSGDNATVQLTGDIIKKMEKEDFNLSIKKDKVEYKVPASEITIDKVAGILGVASKDLKDINIEVKINKVSDEVLAKYNEVAKQFKNEFVVPPVDFEIVAKTTGTDGKARETTVSKFSNYVERVLEIPANVDASKITTGIVFNADGTYSHVPTEVFQKDGKWYARLNSLTNSTYSVIYNPITVDSVKGHWSEKTVNDMASRLVLIDYTNFDAKEAVTRAEFADYIVRALGLYREDVTLKTTFKDVTADSKNSRSIQIASDWGIISGYTDGTFKATSTITRQESMVMYAKAMEIAKIAENKANKLATYTDNAEVAKWATPSVQRVVNADIFNGKGNGVLSPKGTLTQAEALTAVRNLLVKAELISE